VIDPSSEVQGLPKAPPIADLTPRLTGFNKAAVASFVLSFLPLGCPIAVILGHVARHQLKRYPQDGGGLSIAGMVIGYVHLAFWITFFVSA
jgi:hypothetical protein